MQDLPNGGGGAPIQALAPGRWRPSGRHWIYERYVFQCRIQGPDEEFDRFVDDLRQLSASCLYGELEDERVVLHGHACKISYRL